MSRPTIGDDLAGFCRAEWPRLVGSLGLYLGDSAQAEDLAQETLVRVAERWPKVRVMSSPSAWAHRVAFNLAKSHFRHRAVQRKAMPRLARSDEASLPDVNARVEVMEALSTLPKSQRGVLILRYFADLTVHETALALGCPKNTVKTHTRRGLLALRERLSGREIPQPEEEFR